MKWERAIQHAGDYRRVISPAPLIVLGYKTERGWRYMVWAKNHPAARAQRSIPPQERR